MVEWPKESIDRSRCRCEERKGERKETKKERRKRRRGLRHENSVICVMKQMKMR